MVVAQAIDELKIFTRNWRLYFKAIMAIAFNKKIIPLDGNVERILKRVFYLRKENEITKDYLNKKKYF